MLNFKVNDPVTSLFVDNVKSNHLYVVWQTNDSNDRLILYSNVRTVSEYENAGISWCCHIRIKNDINDHNFLKKHAAQVANYKTNKYYS